MGNGFIREQIDAHAVRPLVIGMLGNTLGNLDRRENVFLLDIGQMLEKRDYLLLEVSLAGPKWSWETDQKGDPKRYLRGEKRFFATTISKKAKIPLETVISDFEKYVKVVPGESDVPGAHTLSIRHAIGDPIQVCNIRRYNFEKLKLWLSQKNFEIVYEKTIFDPRECKGYGVLLLQPKRGRHIESNA